MSITHDAVTQAPGGLDGRASFEELKQQAGAAGLLDGRPGYYAWKIPANIALFAMGWVAFFLVGNSWWQLAVAVCLGICYVQTGLIGHDLGHLQVTKNLRVRDGLGYLHGNLLLGFSYGWWVNHHNRHHGNPNHLERDPDIKRRRVIFTVAQADQPMSRIRKFIIRQQGWIFFPLLLLESLGLRAVSAGVLHRREVPRVKLEALLIAVHVTTYAVVVFSTLDPLLAVAFALVHQCTFGIYSGSIFAPNHKGMPVRGDEESLGWLARQVTTSRNIRSGRIADFMYGGLNYQIEHHVFPTMPRANLRHVRPIVKRYCEETGLTYHETSMPGAYLEVVRHMGLVSKQYRARTATGA
jgi:fatty acid desaturase